MNRSSLSPERAMFCMKLRYLAARQSHCSKWYSTVWDYVYNWVSQRTKLKQIKPAFYYSWFRIQLRLWYLYYYVMYATFVKHHRCWIWDGLLSVCMCLFLCLWEWLNKNTKGDLTWSVLYKIASLQCQHTAGGRNRCHITPCEAQHLTFWKCSAN